MNRKDDVTRCTNYHDPGTSERQCVLNVGHDGNHLGARGDMWASHKGFWAGGIDPNIKIDHRKPVKPKAKSEAAKKVLG